MGKQIELPAQPAGTEQEQLQKMYSYLYRMAQDLNSNLNEIGGTAFTDEEMAVVREVIGQDDVKNGAPEAETLKSLIIKTAQFVKSEIDEYNLKLFGNYKAEGKFGKYVRKTGLDVDVTPEGIQQNYTFQEIIQGLKTYEVNAKNYIKTGLLRTVSSVPVYGVAIGKDIVTFAEDGTETYNDGNKVAELTDDELSFYQNGVKLASYKGTELCFYQSGNLCMKMTGSRISFYQNSTEVLYISGGKIYSATDMIIDSNKTIQIGQWEFSGNSIGITYGTYNEERFYITAVSNKARFNISNSLTGEYAKSELDYGGYRHQGPSSSEQSRYNTDILNATEVWAKDIDYTDLHQNSSRDVKHNIRGMESNGERIDRLRPVTFIYNGDPEERKRTGLIYEEAVEVMPEICTAAGQEKAINYVELVPVLLKEIQELRARVKALEER